MDGTLNRAEGFIEKLFGWFAKNHLTQALFWGLTIIMVASVTTVITVSVAVGPGKAISGGDGDDIIIASPFDVQPIEICQRAQVKESFIGLAGYVITAQWSQQDSSGIHAVATLRWYRDADPDHFSIAVGSQSAPVTVDNATLQCLQDKPTPGKGSLGVD